MGRQTSIKSGMRSTARKQQSASSSAFGPMPESAPVAGAHGREDISEVRSAAERNVDRASAAARRKQRKT